MSLVHSTLKFIQKHDLFTKEDHLLIAVSGGVDSLTMLDVLNKLGYKLSVAHINYRLRENDSDCDQEFVQEECIKRSIPCYINVCSDQLRDFMKAGNLQAKARDIRYQFFNDLIIEKHIKFVCTAHTSDDQVETFVYNAIRGSGLNGLSSLNRKRQSIVRPFLETSKKEIIQYAADNKIAYRTDQSNLTLDYDRNYIRNNTLSQLEKRFPDIRKSIKRTISNLNDENQLLNHLLDQMKIDFTTKSNDGMIISNLDQLRLTPGNKSLLIRWLHPYQFNLDQVQGMLSARVGAVFSNQRFMAVIDRNRILIKTKYSTSKTATIIAKYGVTQINGQQKLHIDIIDKFDTKTDTTTTEIVDASKLEFPLSIRSWVAGDRMQPLGMKGKSKKLSDIFVDLKFNAFQKEEIQLLCNKSGEIVWMIGSKLSENVKIDSNTSKFVKLALSNS